RHPPSHKPMIELTYITGRGNWYFRSWKGDSERSGGVASNIGIHFYDLLIWLFGSVKRSEVHFSTPKTASGSLELDRAEVTWFLSVEAKFLPKHHRASNHRTHRSIRIDEEAIDLSEGFTDLHTQVYRETLNGNGVGISDTRPAIQLIHDVRIAAPIGIQPHSHSLLKNENDVEKFYL
ncbi:MAG: Gfo/Idh/MocA family oxidoreductase, partial [Verrucomicrobiales bacterium]|nr:Gfo/Idh/MocA family oxidoreductase [Verrucomicrobiales bacterium]